MFSSIVSLIGYAYKAVSSYLEFKNLKQLLSNKTAAIRSTLKYLMRKDTVSEIEKKSSDAKSEKIKKEDQTIEF